jgi:DNA-directed RNA polymerase specialized sigma24 family protein
LRQDPVSVEIRATAETGSTRWSVALGAAEGTEDTRELFARHYEPVVRSHLVARWRGTPFSGEIDDVVQEVFIDCFREDGALGRVEPERGGFRGFLYGVVRNVARRCEEQRARSARQADSRTDPGAIEAREEPLSKVFDRAWARSLLEQAGRLQAGRIRGWGGSVIRGRVT